MLHTKPKPQMRWRLFHVVGVVLVLPVVALARVVPRRRQKRESIFAEANRAVLTALGFALMS